MAKPLNCFFSCFLCLIFFPAFAQKPDTSNFAIVIHGGAGTILRKNMTSKLDSAYRLKLDEALKAGYNVLKNGGTSMDAVETSIKIMEDSPLFNAGKGSVFTNDGRNEMDASIMDGKSLMAGAVAGVRTIKNPITAARAVMEKSQHVMMVGKGAEKFAKEKGITIVDTSYFYDDKRWNQLKKLKEKEIEKEKGNLKMDHDTLGSIEENLFLKEQKFGTVGAVALDKYGNIAAGTSTGGMSNKKFGRVGDSPIIGAGTYANNNTCAISCTGHGEYFIRLGVAHEISAMMEHKKSSLESAAKEVIHKKLQDLGGDGGVIGIDRKGNITMTFNTDGMYRGFMKKEGKTSICIYKEE